MKHVLGWVLALLPLLALGPGAHAQEAAPPDSLDRYAEQAMRDWDVPGLALAVVKDDAVVLAKGYGVRELGKPAPVTEETLFLLASTTKAFTAAALGMLVEEGALDWDDPVTKYLPDFQLQSPYVTRELTVRDLLAHRVGIERGDRLWWASPFDREEVLRRARFLAPVSSFRSGYGYNNIMYIAAGEVVEAVSGMSWDRFIEERLFEPLGMQASTTSIRALPGAEGNVATPHARIEGEVQPIPWRNFDNLGGAGALNANVLDMAQWLRLQLGAGTYEGQPLLEAKTVEEMHAAQTVIQVSDAYEELHPMTHFRAYGLGWFLQDYRGHKVVQHSGSLDGMRARVGMIPEENLGVVLLANMTESTLLEALLFRIFDAYLGAPERDWSALLLAERQEERAEAEARQDSIAAARVAGTSPSLALGRYAGTYADSAYGEATITREGDHLVLRKGPAFTGDLQHWHYDTFRVVWRDPYQGKTFATFTLDAAGEVDAVNVEDLTRFGRVSEATPHEADAEEAVH